MISTSLQPMRGLGVSTRHIVRSRKETGIWPYDTVRNHWPEDLKPVYAGQIEAYQAALRLAGHRDHAEEDADFGVRRIATCISITLD